MKLVMGQKNKKGFTLRETLLTVAIIVILFAVSIPAVYFIQKNLQFTELNDTAREIYVAAQNRMNTLKAARADISGAYNASDPDCMSLAIVEIGEDNMPQDFADTDNADVAEHPTGNWDESFNNYYVLDSTDASAPGALSAIGRLLPANSIDATVLSNCFVIEYNVRTYTVYGVWYTTEALFNKYGGSYSLYDHIQSLSDREKETRKGHDPMLGYYGGTDTISLEVVDTPPMDGLFFFNCENLELIIKNCQENTNYTLSVEGSGAGDLLFSVGDGALFVTPPTGYNAYIDNNQSLHITFDSLDKNLHFANLFPDLTPGQDVNVSVFAQISIGLSNPSATMTASANSLFDAVSGDSVSVSCGRHLQNLEPTVSNYNAAQPITVTQIPYTPIDSTEEGRSYIDWSYYANKTVTKFTGDVGLGSFLSIGNDKIAAYDGDELDIMNLSCVPNGDGCGLFASLNNAAVTDVRIKDQTVASAPYAGGLAAKAIGCDISGCEIFLTKYATESGAFSAAIAAGYGVHASAYGGGLVGFADGTDITESLSAVGIVELTGSGSAGGLVGETAGTCAISKSYANTAASYTEYVDDGYTGGLRCNVSGASVGGLIGKSTNGVTVSDCYALATVMTSSGVKAGGFTGSVVGGSYNRCYSVSVFGGDPVYRRGFAQNSTGTLTQCYYLAEDSVTDANGNIIRQEPDTFFGAISNTGTDMRTRVLLSGGNLSVNGSANDADCAFTHALKGSQSTHPYEFAGNYYFYPKLKELVHYGDWPLTDVEPVQLAYYEIYNDNGAYKLAVYNDDTMLVNDLVDDLPVVQDGYMLLIEKNPVVENNEATVYGGINLSNLDNKLDVRIGTDNGNIGSGLKSVEELRVNSAPMTGLTYITKTEAMTKNSTITVHNTEFVCRFLTYDTVVDYSAAEFAVPVKVKLYVNNGGSDFQGETVFGYVYNPWFAKSFIYDNEWFPELDGYFEASNFNTFANSACSVAAYTEWSEIEADKGYPMYIRTERQYATLTRVEAARWWNGTNNSKNKPYTFMQERDLVFGENNQYTTTFFDKTVPDEYRNTTNPIGLGESSPFTGAYDGGVYDENGLLAAENSANSITGAVIAGSRSSTGLSILDSWLSIIIRAIFGGSGAKENYGLFGYVDGGSIKNLVVDSIQVNTADVVSGVENVGGLVGFGNNITISSVTMIDPSVHGKIRVGGLAGVIGEQTGSTDKNTLTSVTVRSGEVTGSTMVGGAVGQLNGYCPTEINGASIDGTLTVLSGKNTIDNNSENAITLDTTAPLQNCGTGAFGGSLNMGGNQTVSLKNISFGKTEGSKIKAEVISGGYNSNSVGGLFGNIYTQSSWVKLSLDGLSFDNTDVILSTYGANDNGAGLVCGQIKMGTNGYTAISNVTQTGCTVKSEATGTNGDGTRVAVGGYFGYALDDSDVNISDAQWTLPTVSGSLPSLTKDQQRNFGGFVGRIGNNGSKFTFNYTNKNGFTADGSEASVSGQGFVGGYTGYSASTVGITGITVKVKSVTGSGTSDYEATGGLIGCAKTPIENVKVILGADDNIRSVSAEGKYIGGVVGVCFEKNSNSGVGSIKNASLTTTGSICATNDKYVSCVGGIVGYTYYSVTDCQNTVIGGSVYTASLKQTTVNTTNDNYIFTTSCTGGLVGGCKNSVANCSLEIAGAVYGGEHVGGAVGMTTNTVSKLKVKIAGITGDDKVVRSVYSTARTYTNTYSSVGGVIGYASYTWAPVITEMTELHIGGTVEGKCLNVGGVIGYTPGSVTGLKTVTIDGSVVGGTKFTGGVAGVCTNGISDLETVTIGGNVTGNGGCVGGIIANAEAEIKGTDNKHITVTISGADGVTGGNYSGGIAGKSQSAMEYIDLNITGGVAAVNETNTAGGYAGGAIGRSTAGCKFITVTVGKVVSAQRDAGGFVGYTSWNGCTYSDITVKAGGVNSTMVEGATAGSAGGFAGACDDSGNAAITLTNIGVTVGDPEQEQEDEDTEKAISSSLNTGGMLGHVQGRGTFTATACVVDSSAVIGVGEGDDGYTGGFFGKILANGTYVTKRCHVTNSYIGGAGDYTGGFVAELTRTNLITVEDDTAKEITARQTSMKNALSELERLNDKDAKLTALQYADCLADGIPVYNCDVVGRGKYVGGFVGRLTETVKNLSIDGTSVYGESDTGYTGGFAGMIAYSGTTNNKYYSVTDCDVRLSDYIYGEASYGKTLPTITGCGYTGGFVGAFNTGTNFNLTSVSYGSTAITYKYHRIANCFAAIPVEGLNDTSTAGGFVGAIENSIIENCYASGDVTGLGKDTGGFIGYMTRNTDTDSTHNFAPFVYSCYATGDVFGYDGYVGGFVGYVEKGVTSTCYSVGLVEDKGGHCGGFMGGTSHHMDFGYTQTEGDYYFTPNDVGDCISAFYVAFIRTKVVNRSNSWAPYLLDISGNIIHAEVEDSLTKETAERDIYSPKCQYLYDVLPDMDSKATAVNKASYIQPPNANQGKPSDSTDKNTAVSNLIAMINRYDKLSEVLNKGVWLYYKNTESDQFIWSTYATTPDSAKVTDIPEEFKVYKFFGDDDKCIYREANATTGASSFRLNIYSMNLAANGASTIVKGTDTVYINYSSAYATKYYALSKNANSIKKETTTFDTVSDVVTIGCYYLGNDGVDASTAYNSEYTDFSSDDGIERWTTSDFQKEFVGSTSDLYGMITAYTASNPYELLSGSFSYPAIKDCGYGVEGGVHWGNWPDKSEYTGYIAYREHYSGGGTGYYSEDGGGGVIFSTLDDSATVADWDYCYLGVGDSVVVQYRATQTSSTYIKTTLTPSGSVTIDGTDYNVFYFDDIIERQEGYGVRDTASGLYFELYCDSMKNQYCPYFGKAAVAGDRKTAFNASLRNQAQWDNLCDYGYYPGLDDVTFLQERDLMSSGTVEVMDAAYDASMEGGRHTLSSALSGPVFRESSNSIKNLILNFSGSSATGALTQESTGSITAVDVNITGAASASLAQTSSGSINGCTVTVSGGTVASGIAAAVTDGSVSSCTVNAPSGSITGAGLVTTLSSGGTVSGCTVTGTVQSDGSAAGLVLTSGGDISNCAFNGLVGGGSAAGAVMHNSGVLSGLTVNADVTATTEAAGFVLINDGSIGSFTPEEGDPVPCTFTGAVTSDGTAAGFALTSDGSITGCAVKENSSVTVGGGGAGFVLTQSGGTITDCSTRVSVTTETGDASGFAASVQGEISGCFFVGSVRAENGFASGFAGDVTGLVTGCVTSAEITGGSGAGFAQSCANAAEIAITGCYTASRVSAVNSAYGFVGSGMNVTESWCATALKGAACFTFGGGESYDASCLYLNNDAFDADDNIIIPTVNGEAQSCEQMNLSLGGSLSDGELARVTVKTFTVTTGYAEEGEGEGWSFDEETQTWTQTVETEETQLVFKPVSAPYYPEGAPTRDYTLTITTQAVAGETPPPDQEPITGGEAEVPVIEIDPVQSEAPVEVPAETQQPEIIIQPDENPVIIIIEQ